MVERQPVKLDVGGSIPSGGAKTKSMKKFQVKPDMILVYVPNHAKGDQSHIDCEPGKFERFIDDNSAFVKYFKKENGQLTSQLQDIAKATLLKNLWPVGMEACPDCDGKGEAYFSCCSGERVDADMPICPQCKEHLGEDECPTCNGTGLVSINDYVKAGPVVDLIGIAEAAYEGER